MTKATLIDQTNQEIKRLIQSSIEKDRSGRPDLAEKDLRHALNLNNKHPDVLNLLAVLCSRSQRLEEALKLIKKAVKFAPKSAPIHFNYGNILAQSGDYEAARAEFIKSTSLDIRFAPAYKNLGAVLATLRQFSAAIDAFEHYLKLNPHDIETQINLGTALLQVGRPSDARTILQNLYDQSDNPSLELVSNLALIYLDLSNTQKSEELYRQAIELNPKDPDVWGGLGHCLSQRNLPREAEQAFEKAKSYGLNHVYADQQIAEALLDGGFYDDAMKIFTSLCDQYPDNISLLSAAALADARMGDFDSQELKLRHILKISPKNMAAFSQLATIPGRKFTDKDLYRLLKLCNNPDFDKNVRRASAFALGDIYRGTKDYDQAFHYFKIGNDLKGFEFDKNKHEDFISSLIETFDKAFFEQRYDWGNKSPSPILIVGTPRSGTTLTEQILAAHPQVTAAGERGSVPSMSLEHLSNKPRIQQQPTLIKGFDKHEIANMADSYLSNIYKVVLHNELRITNKLPGNFIWVGLFALLFPSASVIHTKRDPRDSLLSIYFKDFGGMHDYAYKLEDLGFWYQQYERIMMHWDQVLPGRILSIDYENTVNNQEAVSRQLIDHIGLDWNERVLEYYKNKRTVKTASIWQARQPIYKTSVQRWKHYEKHLKPLFDSLSTKI